MLPSDHEAEEFIRRQIERLPPRIAGRIARLRRASRLVRLPVGILMILAGFAWFLPVVGFWMLPIGVVLLAEELPITRRLLAGAGMAIARRFRRGRRDEGS